MARTHTTRLKELLFEPNLAVLQCDRPVGGPTIRIDQPGPLWAWFDPPRAVAAVVAAGLDRANVPVGSVVWVTVVNGASDGTVVAIADGWSW